MTAVLISGSIAYDTVCRLEGRFENLILPRDIAHLNLTFLASSMTRSFGGCAPNIAWSLKALGGEPVILSAVGRDGEEYLQHLRRAGIDTSSIGVFGDEWTSQVFITTDSGGNQLATFVPGAMQRAHEVALPAGLKSMLVHIAPGGLEAMRQLAARCREDSVPYVFDPGQATSQLEAGDLREIESGACLTCLSEYEAALLEKRLGISLEKKASQEGRRYLVTYGAGGCAMLRPEGKLSIPAVPAKIASGTVGAGDAFRGGLLFGMTRGLSDPECLKLGALMSAFRLEGSGAQGWRPSQQEIRERYGQAWGEPFPVPPEGGRPRCETAGVLLSARPPGRR
ncbi:carbohydrate kinase family protein [Mesosutterella sp. OilRF-GAM-744-9]|uniref:Carbohydrate kinase family protein n=1 Tax=Mesosutterella porci TaxID=2915351 RepID=A0ABS9MRN2_9BURK|nr:carbohydrate kinase family protein [Mesosutterella sp. oilRF-744-WT-GAM-9]MCG5031293.1 carbohydrate kinase family protein [Mesosutterella sp. oilRF-744-WT-GAM-9]